jgi:hypothetical protein
MSQVLRHSRIYLRNWKLLLFSFFAPVLITVPLILGTAVKGEVYLGFLILATLGLVGGLAFFLASAQQELMSRAFTFLLPDLRQGMSRLLGLGGLALFIVVLASVFLTPAYHTYAGSLASLAWSTASLMLAVYGLVLLLVFASVYSSWLPFNVLWATFFVIRFFIRTPDATYFRFLDHPELWTPLAVLVAWMVHRRLNGSGLHRRLIEEPYISIVDLKDQAKIEHFKQARHRHKGQLEGESRPGHQILTSLVAYVAQANARGRRALAATWEAHAVFLMTSIPRNRWRLGLLILFLPAMVVFTGYADGYSQARMEDTDLIGWYPGFVFMLMYFPALIFHYVKTRPVGLLRSRGVTYRAGYLAMALTVGLSLAGSAVAVGLFQIGEMLLPAFTYKNCLINFGGPQGPTPFLPLFCLPYQMLIHTLWRQRGSIMVLQQSGTLLFFLFHGVLTMGGPTLLLPVAAAALLGWLALPLAWHWRTRRSDLA